MIIELVRLSHNQFASVGELRINGQFVCHTVEDVPRPFKVRGETRIPDGVYSLGLRKEGGMNGRYAKRFPDMHKGMICAFNANDWKLVNGGMEFQYIYIHIGNYHKQSQGCILVNTGIKDYSGFGSEDAYKKVYPIIAQAILSGEECTLNVLSLDKELYL